MHVRVTEEGALLAFFQNGRVLLFDISLKSWVDCAGPGFPFSEFTSLGFPGLDSAENKLGGEVAILPFIQV